MDERGQFTFYRSIWEAIRRIKKAADRASAYDAICAYALDGTEPDLDALPDTAAIAFISVRPNLDASKAKASNGKKGGRPPKEENLTETKAKANGKQTKPNENQSESEKERENEKEGEREKEKENECYRARGAEAPEAILAEFSFSPELEETVRSWLAYKREKRQSYKPTGLRTLLGQLQKAEADYGAAAVVEVIRNSMASGYQGIMLDRLQTRRAQPAARSAADSLAWIDEWAAQEG